MTPTVLSWHARDGLSLFTTSHHLHLELTWTVVSSSSGFLGPDISRARGSGLGKSAVSFGPGKRKYWQILASPLVSSSSLSKDILSRSIASFPACFSNQAL